ncbi:MAG TPA: TetR/AcrR family transcriptional regulator [Pseudonocardia sp.]|jgi:AcrR family transcriptional regulator
MSGLGDRALRPKVMQRPGGRSDRVLKQVVAATAAILAEQGVAGVTVEAVALRAGISRTTIYRRWKTPQLLMLEALRVKVSPDRSPVVDTGTLRGDLRALLQDIADYLLSNDGTALFNAVFLQAQVADEEAVRSFFDQRFLLAGQVVERAKLRGELAGNVRARSIIELAASPIYFRAFFTREPVTSEFLDEMVDNALKVAGAVEGRPEVIT